MKLEDRGGKMMFVGYEKGNKAYRGYDPLTGRVTIIRDVVFDESAQWVWSEDSEADGDSSNNIHGTFTIQYMLLHEEGGEATEDPATPPATPTGPEAGLFTAPPGGHSATPRGESQMKMILTSTMMMHPYGCAPWMMCWAQGHQWVMLHESLAEEEMIVCSLSGNGSGVVGY
jgi:hypothetical protein